MKISKAEREQSRLNMEEKERRRQEVYEQNYKDVILSSSQYYINQNFCLHIVTVMGTAHRLTELSDKLTTIKGIKHGKLVMSRAD